MKLSLKHRRSIQISPLVVLLLAGAVLLSACRPVVIVEGEQPAPTNTPQPTALPVLQEATPTPIPVPPGDEENPLVMAIVSETEDADMESAGFDLAAQISERTGLNVQSQMFSSYQQVLDGLGSGEVQMAWLPPLTYLQASRMGRANAALLTNHLGTYTYGTQFFANVDSDFKVYFDPGANMATADAGTALDQFSGKRPCFTEPSSPSGYVVPEGLLLQNDLSFEPPVEAQTYASVLRALYVGGICDFGATYSITGDPRTASSMSDLPDLMDKVVVIWQSDPIIPNLNFSFVPSVSLDVRGQISQALLDIAADETGLQTISDATNYDVQALKEILDNEYDPLREVVDLAKPDAKVVIGK